MNTVNLHLLKLANSTYQTKECTNESAEEWWVQLFRKKGIKVGTTLQEVGMADPAKEDKRDKCK